MELKVDVPEGIAATVTLPRALGRAGKLVQDGECLLLDDGPAAPDIMVASDEVQIQNVTGSHVFALR